MPFRADDFLNGTGTERLDGSVDALRLLATSCMDDVKANLYVPALDRAYRQEWLAQSSSKRDVLVAAIDDGDHWVAFIDISGGTAYYACSLIVHDWEVEYSERKSPLGRTYNSSGTVGGAERVGRPCICHIYLLKTTTKRSERIQMKINLPLLALFLVLGGCSTAGPYITNVSSDGRNGLNIEKCAVQMNAFMGTVSNINCTTQNIQLSRTN